VEVMSPAVMVVGEVVRLRGQLFPMAQTAIA
jgi:siroheme synthase